MLARRFRVDIHLIISVNYVCLRIVVLFFLRKPGNILVLRNCRILVSDFGLAREKPTREKNSHLDSDGSDINNAMTQHVVTRWYRPPELMLYPDGFYTTAVDMWSLGCVFAELLGRKALFPGKSFIHQLTLILDLIGSPRPEQVAHIKSRQAMRFLDSVKGRQKKDFRDLFPECHPNATDLLEKLLAFNPSERVDARTALAHPYLEAAHHMGAFVKEPEVKLDCDFQFEAQSLGIEDFKLLIREEVGRISGEDVTSPTENTQESIPNGRRRDTAVGKKRTVRSTSVEETKAVEKRKPLSTLFASENKSHERNNERKDSIELRKGNCRDLARTRSSDSNADQESSEVKQSVRPSQNCKYGVQTAPKSPKFSTMSWQKKVNGMQQISAGQ